MFCPSSFPAFIVVDPFSCTFEDGRDGPAAIESYRLQPGSVIGRFFEGTVWPVGGCPAGGFQPSVQYGAHIPVRVRGAGTGRRARGVAGEDIGYAPVLYGLAAGPIYRRDETACRGTRVYGIGRPASYGRGPIAGLHCACLSTCARTPSRR